MGKHEAIKGLIQLHGVPTHTSSRANLTFALQSQSLCSLQNALTHPFRQFDLRQIVLLPTFP